MFGGMFGKSPPQAPRQKELEISFTIPPGVSPGQIIMVNAGGREIHVTIPPDGRPGDTMKFRTAIVPVDNPVTTVTDEISDELRAWGLEGAAEQEIPGSWECSSCTFRHKEPTNIDATVCECCGSARQNIPARLLDQGPATGISGIVPWQNEVPGKWECAFCTFSHNELSNVNATFCQCCGKQRVAPVIGAGDHASPLVADLGQMVDQMMDLSVGNRQTFEIEPAVARPLPTQRARSFAFPNMPNMPTMPDMPDMPTLPDRKTMILAGGIILGAFLILLLIPLGHSKVEYYESGLKAQRSTGKVDRKEVYGSGNHFIGPDYEFRKYQTSLNFFSESLEVWTKSDDDDAGTSVTLDIAFEYKLQKDRLGDLYSLVALNYDPLIRSKAIDSIVSTAPYFSIDSYLTKRQFVAAALQSNVSTAISDVYADVVGFQLNFIDLKPDFRTSRLNAAIQLVSNDKEAYVQEAAIVRAETEVSVLRIENNASRVTASAQAAAQLIEAEATNDATALVEQARGDGLKNLYEELGLTKAAHKASLDYMLSLEPEVAATEISKQFVNFKHSSMQFQSIS